jgi:hypothetical protein
MGDSSSVSCPMGKLDVVGAVVGALALGFAGCTSAPVGSDPPTSSTSASTSSKPASTSSKPASSSKPEAGTATSVGSGQKACTVNADCPGGQVCNCRCAPGVPCNGPADACGDCGKLKMIGVCLPSCEGG